MTTQETTPEEEAKQFAAQAKAFAEVCIQKASGAVGPVHAAGALVAGMSIAAALELPAADIQAYVIGLMADVGLSPAYTWEDAAAGFAAALTAQTAAAAGLEETLLAQAAGAAGLAEALAAARFQLRAALGAVQAALNEPQNAQAYLERLHAELVEQLEDVEDAAANG